MLPVTTHTLGGKTFRCSSWTAAHLQHTIDVLREKHPAAQLVVIQGCYNTTVAASAGTHSADGVLDVRIDGLPWLTAQAFLRSLGWAAWWRHQGAWAPEAAWHIHMGTIPPGLPNRPTAQQVGAAYVALGIQVGKYIDGGYTTSSPHQVTASSQIVDYFAHAFGLANLHRPGSDTTWFPPSIQATVFDMRSYTAAKVAAGQPTYKDITEALLQFGVRTQNANAKPIYDRARTIVGKLVRDKTTHRVPETTAEVVEVLAAKRKATPLTAVWTRYRLTTVIRLLRPLA